MVQASLRGAATDMSSADGVGRRRVKAFSASWAFLLGAFAAFDMADIRTASAEQALRPPRPSTDYAVRGRTVPDGGEIRIAYRGGLVRVELSSPGRAAMVIGLINLESHRMTLLSGLEAASDMALEIDVPPKYLFLDLPEDSRYLGSDIVATEPCGVWEVAAPGRAAQAEVCLSEDGIPLRARARKGSDTVAFEVRELERVPQDETQFHVPKGTKVTRIPKGMQKLVPGLLN